MSTSEEESEFDAERAASLVGKSVLVGLTYADAEGNTVNQVQLFGHVTSFDETIATLKLDSGEDFTLPPAVEAFEDAAPGEYRLLSTGEVIVDPDLISTWTISAPSDDSDDDEQANER
jgi:hypothetical protein